MGDMLEEAQKRLEEHFSELHRRRALRGYPVYALEHAQRPEEIDALAAALSADLKTVRYASNRYWLAWIIIAAEIGYVFDGDEYWRTFAQRVPGWNVFGSREQIRSWFLTFQKKYGGFVPTGPWAQHFSIIAWPITHSILPMDLQVHFARRLWELRHDLARAEGLSPRELGDLVGYDSDGSSRFHHFLQQTELVGSLVLSLRDADSDPEASAIEQRTLARIVSDLERHRSARSWLSDTRREFRQARIQAHGFKSTSPRTPTFTRGMMRRAKGPRLCALESSDGTWTLGVSIPDIMAILRDAGASPSALQKTRISLPHRPDVWMPGGALLTVSRKDIPLRSATVLAGDIIKLEKPTEPLSRLFESELRLPCVSPWLLRIQDDGVARQVIGNHIRAGCAYILATTSPLSEQIVTDLGLHPADGRTADAFIYKLAVPNHLPDEYLARLTLIGLGYSLKVRVEIAGLVPRRNSAGDTIWLPHEEPLLRLTADCPVREYVLRLDEGEWSTITPSSDSTTISLGQLPLGQHTLEVGAILRGNAFGQFTRVETEVIGIEIRSPEPWPAGIQAQAGFRMILEPANAGLDDLLARRASITVSGPEHRKAQLEVRLYDFHNEIVARHRLGYVLLPANAASVYKILRVLADDRFAPALQSSLRVDIVCTVEELGTSTVSLQQRIDPLRWKLESADGRYIARLVNELDADSAIAVLRIDLKTPDRARRVEASAGINGIVVEPPGALFHASASGNRSTAFVSVAAKTTLSEFRELQVPFSLSNYDQPGPAVARLVPLLRMWRTARPLGVIANTRRDQIVQALEDVIIRLLCSAPWAALARRCLNGEIELLQRLQHDVVGSPSGFAARLRAISWTLGSPTRAALDEFASLALTYRICADRTLCRLALQLAFAPERLKLRSFPDRGVEMFTRLSEEGSLARGAYFARIVAATSRQEVEQAA